jgi:hypothetical protein
VQKCHRSKKLDGEAEAYLVATDCSSAKDVYSVWMMPLLDNRLVEHKIVDSISSDLYASDTKKNDHKPW